MTTWPNPERPGVPLNPEVDGWHLFRLAEGLLPIEWLASVQVWFNDLGGATSSLPPAELAAEGYEYLGPVRTDADVQAAAKAARVQALEDAAGVCAEQRRAFGSTEYAGGALNALPERFACERCEEEIRALKEGGE